METKHTKGEWEVREIYSGAYLVGTGQIEYIDTKGVRRQGYKQIANIGGNYFPIEQAEANAKLIAAAPDMLSVLIEAVKHSHVYDTNPALVELFNSVIKKATL